MFYAFFFLRPSFSPLSCWRFAFEFWDSNDFGLGTVELRRYGDHSIANLNS